MEPVERLGRSPESVPEYAFSGWTTRRPFCPSFSVTMAAAPSWPDDGQEAVGDGPSIEEVLPPFPPRLVAFRARMRRAGCLGLRVGWSSPWQITPCVPNTTNFPGAVLGSIWSAGTRLTGWRRFISSSYIGEVSAPLLHILSPWSTPDPAGTRRANLLASPGVSAGGATIRFPSNSPPAPRKFHGAGGASDHAGRPRSLGLSTALPRPVGLFLVVSSLLVSGNGSPAFFSFSIRLGVPRIHGQCTTFSGLGSRTLPSNSWMAPRGRQRSFNPE